MRYTAYISLAFILFSCMAKEKEMNQPYPAITISAADTALHLVNGIWLHKNGKPFDGIIKEDWPGGIPKSLQNIDAGKQEGFTETFYADGKPESRRWYTKGEKDSVHIGWWANGNTKYEYHFSNGDYNGLFTEWYESGKMIQQVIYEKGKEVSGKGWRENGKLYMSFVMKNGRRYGLFNANLCYSLVKQDIK